MDSPLTIRDATLADTVPLAALSEQLGYPASPQEIAERLPGVLTATSTVLVAVLSDGSVVGWVHVFAEPMLVAEHAAEVGGLIVGEGHRNGGVGQWLLTAAEDWARAHGLTHLYVRSNVIRERAHRFYEREGYETIKRQRIFHKAL